MSSDEGLGDSEWEARVKLTRALYRKAMLERAETETAKLKPTSVYAISAAPDSHNSLALELDRQTRTLGIAEAIAAPFLNEQVAPVDAL